MKNGLVKIQDAEVAKYNKRLFSIWERIGWKVLPRVFYRISSSS